MSEFVPKVLQSADNIMNKERSIESIVESRNEEEKVLFRVVRQVFENGIIPIAQKNGYKISVPFNHLGSWEDFISDDNYGLRERIKNYHSEGKMGIAFYLTKEGEKCLKGRFDVKGYYPILEIEIWPQVRNDILAYHWGDIRDARSGKVISRLIAPKILEVSLESFMTEYETEILPQALAINR